MRSSSPGVPPDGESTPAYLRARFVIGVVVLAVVLGFIMTRVGTARTVQDSGRPMDEPPAVDVGASTTPRSTDPDDCPEPGARVPLDAAELLTVFMAAVADPTVGQLPATKEVQGQIDATAPSPPLTRMTRVRGFAGEPGTWSTCAMSYWMGAEGPMQSLDVVTVAVVSGEDRSGADSGADRDEDTDRSRTRSQQSAERWEVTRWLRGEPQPTPRTRVASLSFFNGSGCSRPDREVSVAIPVGPSDSRLRTALEEVISGSVGRSPTASSSVPLDIQVVDATVDGSSVRVVLTPTADQDMSRCDGTAAYAQVVGTASAIARESLDPDSGGEPAEVDVEVIVSGGPVDTLRP